MPDQDAVARFVERFAGGLADAGMPRMPARVFVALLATARRDDYVRRWAAALEEGIAAVGPDTPAGARLAETQAFFAFMQKEMPALVERWQEYRSLGG